MERSSARRSAARPRRWPWAGGLGPFAALAAVVLFFAAAEFGKEAWKWRRDRSGTLAEFVAQYDAKFWSSENFRTMAARASIVAVAALGMTVVIIAGGIDLSAGSALALSATVLAWLLRAEQAIALAVAAALLTGMACGLINGLLTSALRVVPFIVTLGTMTIYLGVAKWVADSTTVRPPLSRVPEWLPALVAPQPKPAWLAVSSGVWLALVLAAALAAALQFTVFGRHVFALGSSEATARLCGIGVPRTKVAVYTLGGLFVGVAGMYQFAQLSSGNPTSGIGMELRIIAAVVIGGGSLAGGRGSVAGTLAGVGIMQAITTGCTILGLRNEYQDMTLGVIIVAAVALDQYRRRRLAA